MRVALGSDHAGFELKQYLVGQLRGRGFECIDLGTHSVESTDYPTYCLAVGEAVVAGNADWGIVLGASGQGEQIAANKVVGVRAALCNEPHYAVAARRDNDANVLALGARLIAPEFALQIVDAWLVTPFAGGRHQRRIDMISAYERRGRPGAS